MAQKFVNSTTTADSKKLKKAQAEKLLRIAFDGRRRPGDRKWARDQLTLSGYATPEERLSVLLNAEGV